MGARVDAFETDTEKDVTEFFSMGGHGLYVWSAYGISLLVVVILGIRPVLIRRRINARYQNEVLSQMARPNSRGLNEDE